ncbi:MAG: leucine--tRNA ligase [archaeon]
MEKINFKHIEKKWQDKWEKEKAFEVSEKSKKPKYYVLEQFPYPSATGLHVGHAFVYTIGDIYARFKIMKGFNVLHPMGYDSFGLPAENAAIKAGIPPKKYTDNAIKYFSKQHKALGLSYDWSRTLNTHDPEYYKWDQWIFLKMFEKGLVYQKKSPVNFCKKCNTVLANEQVHSGNCWIHTDTQVEIKHLNQWYLKITNYAEELANFESVKEWPDLIKKLQKNWIGKSHGTEIGFEVEMPNGKKEKWPIFTTRPDTMYGITFMVISAQHPRLMEIVTDKHKKDVEKFVKKLRSVSQEDIDQLDKEGVFTGSYAINPVNGEKIGIWAGNFVLADYGCGMIMAVPAHDQRDFEFAKKYDIPIRIVIQPDDYEINANKMSRAYTSDGRLVDSGEFTNWNNRNAIDEITKGLEKKKLGKKVIQYRLRDWLISRQRYWGTPIPIVHCEKCGVVLVNEKDLPVELPEKVKFGKGNPLETAESWVKVKCPKCGKQGKRETDTMDTFVNSSWYYLRYCDNKNNKNIFDKKKVGYWCPIDIYIGGKEHATMHDIYMRFYTKFLRDIGLLNIDEPAVKLFVQGFVYGEDGNKMSKSIGNVIDPIDVIKKYGSDALRLFLVSVASPDSNFSWSDKGIQSANKFIIKFYNFINDLKVSKSSKRLESKLNKAIKETSKDIDNFKYNLAIIKIRSLLDVFIEENETSKKDLESFLKIFSVFCPHISEELWSKIGNKGFISLDDWPVVDEKKIDLQLEKQEQQLDNVVSDVMNILKLIREKQGKEAEKVYLYVMPNEEGIYNVKTLNAKIGREVQVFAVNDKKKYDPEEKSKKAKPGRPGIFIE